MIDPKTVPTREALVARLQAMAVARGHRRVTRREFERETGITHHQVACIAGGFTELTRAAGLKAPKNARLTEDELLRALRDACLSAGGIVARNHVARHGAPWPKTYRQHWRSWRDVLAALREWVMHNDPSFAYLGALPSRGGRSPIAVIRAAEAPLYGAPINFRGILHEPVNEQGVVMLFGALAADLGFAVERVGSGFPDCEAKLCGIRGWQRVRVEFEYQSNNFQKHGHDPAACDLIVCWEHNWANCPLEVLELKAEVEKRAARA